MALVLLKKARHFH